jgi:hypothetical protein
MVLDVASESRVVLVSRVCLRSEQNAILLAARDKSGGTEETLAATPTSQTRSTISPTSACPRSPICASSPRLLQPERELCLCNSGRIA